jgi:hypothetical protein
VNTLAIGLGVGLGVLLMIVGAIALFFTCVRQKRQLADPVHQTVPSPSTEQNIAPHYIYTNSMQTLAKEVEFDDPCLSPREIQDMQEIQEMHVPNVTFTGSGDIKRMESIRFQEMPT